MPSTSYPHYAWAGESLIAYKALPVLTAVRCVQAAISPCWSARRSVCSGEAPKRTASPIWAHSSLGGSSSCVCPFPRRCSPPR